jgi:hypothetical protein
MTTNLVLNSSRNTVIARKVSVTANHVLSRKWASSMARSWPKNILWTVNPSMMVR